MCYIGRGLLVKFFKYFVNKILILRFSFINFERPESHYYCTGKSSDNENFRYNTFCNAHKHSSRSIRLRPYWYLWNVGINWHCARWFNANKNDF